MGLYMLENIYEAPTAAKKTTVDNNYLIQDAQEFITSNKDDYNLVKNYIDIEVYHKAKKWNLSKNIKMFEILIELDCLKIAEYWMQCIIEFQVSFRFKNEIFWTLNYLIKKKHIYLFLKLLIKDEIANQLYKDEVTLLLNKCKKKLSFDIKRKVSFKSIHNKNTIKALLHSMTSLSSSMCSKDSLNDSNSSISFVKSEINVLTCEPLPNLILTQNVESHRGHISKFRYLFDNFISNFKGRTNVAKYCMAVFIVCFIWSMSKIPVRLLVIKLLRRIIQK